jgi:hypothetical protein
MPVISNFSLEIDNNKEYEWFTKPNSSFAKSNGRKVARGKHGGVNKNSDKLPKSSTVILNQNLVI